MTNIFKSISFILLLILVSCNNDVATETTVGGTDSIFNSGNAVYMGTNTDPVPNTQTVPGAIPQTGKINPEHGQPGHVCEIPVGQVIPNNLPATNITQQANTTNQIISTQPDTKVAAGMNPAHGQPGHRCDIAVGAPLKDAAPDQTPAPTEKQSNDPAINYPVVSSPLEYKVDHSKDAAVKVADGMNPSHGQPGHRCDISVGAPLPKN